MANIDQDLERIKSAMYGEEVRDSIHNAIKDENNQIEEYVQKFNELKEDTIYNINRIAIGKINKPHINPNGENGQLLQTLGNGETEWSNVGQPTNEQTETAVSNWLNNHPEATTTVEDGAITEEKITDNLKQKINSSLSFNIYNVLSKSNYLNTLAGDENDSYEVQGGTYNSTTFEHLILLADSTNDTVMLVLIDSADFTTVKTRKVYNANILGHANSVTYNPRTNKYYICCNSNSYSVEHMLAVIDAVTLEIDEYFDVENTFWHICYDNLNNVYYLRNGNLISIYDDAFTLLSTIELNDISISGDPGALMELIGGCCYKKYYAVVQINRNSETFRNGSIVLLYSTSNWKLISSITVSNDVLGHEPEHIFAKDDSLYVVYGQSIYTIKQIVPETIPSVDNLTNIFGVFKLLPNNTDLNELISPGFYYISNYNTIKNSAITTCESIVIVKPSCDWGITQIQAKYNGGQMLMAIREFIRNSWSKWTDFGRYYNPNIFDVIHITKAIYFGYFGLNSKDFNFFIPLPLSPNILDSSKIYFTGSFRIRTSKKIYVYMDSSVDISFTNDNLNVSITNSSIGIGVALTKKDGSAFTDLNGDIVEGQSLGCLTSNMYIRYM